MKKRIGIGLSMVLAAAMWMLPAEAAAQRAGRDGAARPRQILALQDDLSNLDESLSQLEPRHRGYLELEQRVEAIRADVTNLVPRMKGGGRNQGNDDMGVSRAEVDALRKRIEALRTDILAVQDRQQARGPDALPPGTELLVRLDQSVSSRSARREQQVEATIVEPVRVDGWTAIPAGTAVAGIVREAFPAGRGQHDGELRLDFYRITFEDGRSVDMRSSVAVIEEGRSGGSTREKAGLGALLGGVVGGLIDGRKGMLIGAAVGAGGALVGTRGQNVELPEGTLLRLRLDAPFILGRR